MKILLLGKHGQVGWELQRALAPQGQLFALDQAECDLSDLSALRAQVRAIQPELIVNAAAYTAVDRAETETRLAHTINADAPGVLAEEAARMGAWLVHYSTDYVFDGTKTTPYVESDATHPLSVYGQSKWLGEEAIRASGCHHLIFRTSWVYAARGANFMHTMLRLAAQRDELRIIADQIGAPTSAELLADVTALAIREVLRTDAGDTAALAGTYHLVAKGETSWHGFARLIVEEAWLRGHPLRCPLDHVLPIATGDYPLPAVRPANSRLATHKLETSFNLVLPEWFWHARRTLHEILN